MSTPSYYVLNSEDRIHQLFRTREPTAEERPPVDDKMANVLPVDRVLLLPGLNLLSEEDLRAVRFDLIQGGPLRVVDAVNADVYMGQGWIERTTSRRTLLALRTALEAVGDARAAMLIAAISANLRKRGETQQAEGAHQAA